MAKAVLILGILCAVVAALFAGNITPGPVLAFTTLAICVAVAIFAFMQRTTLDVVAGVVILIAGILALGAMTPVTGDGKDIVPDMSALGIPMLAIALLLPILWILVRSRETFQPTWLSYVGFGLVAVAIVLVLVQPSSDFGTIGPVGIVAGIACLLLIWPLAMLMRGTPDTRTEPVAATPPPKSTKAVRK